MVWSECDQVLPYLQDIQEYLTSRKKRTVPEILNKVKDTCKKVSLEGIQFNFVSPFKPGLELEYELEYDKMC